MKQQFIALTLGALTLSGASAFATGPASLCAVNKHQPDIISWIPGTPSYFGKMLPEGDAATYIGSVNHLLKLEETDLSKRDMEIPGDIDAVPCPDGKILTVPGLSLFDMGEVRKNGASTPALILDHDLGGVYQSCAVLEVNGDTTKYRVVTDESGTVKYRDYEIEYKQGKADKVTPLRSSAYRCENLNLKTIIISKTGKYLSGYDPSSGTTKVYDIAGRLAGCQMVLDLGFPTGKLEFNFDDTRVAFHMDYFGSNIGDYFSGVGSDLTKDVFTLDISYVHAPVKALIPSNMRRITTSTSKGSGSYYPSFAKDGRLGFINDDANFYSFHIVEPTQVPALNFMIPPPDGWPGGSAPSFVPSDWQRQIHTSATIGSLWAKNCVSDPDEVSAVQAAWQSMALSPSVCLELVRKEWTGSGPQTMSTHIRFERDTRFDSKLVEKLTTAELEAACGKLSIAPAKTPREFGVKLLENLTPKRAVHHYCVGCHTSGGSLRVTDTVSIPNKLDFDDMSKADIASARARIDLPAGPGRMPPAGFGTTPDAATHKELIGKYLDCMDKRVAYVGPEEDRPTCDDEYY